MVFRAITAALALLAIIGWTGSATVIAQDGAVASMQAEDIGLPEDITDVVPIAINSSGDVLVTGISEDGPVTLIYRDGSFDRLGGEDAMSSGAAINESGQVAGWSESNDKISAALIGEDNIVFMPGDYESSRAFTINVEGILAGEAMLDPETELAVPVFWTESSVEALPSAGDGAAGAVFDSNTIQQMVGWSAFDAEAVERHATVWNDETATDLGTLGGPLSEARAINETGFIVGASTTSPDQDAFDAPGSTAFSWFDGQMTDLGLGEGHTWAAANDVNDVRMTVGVAGLDQPGPAGNDTVAILWTGSEVLDLNEIVATPEGLTLVEAVSVNEFGQILCRAIDAEGNARIAVLSVLGN